MAVALKERRPVRGVEILAERPDGRRVPVMPFPTPIKDAAGKFVGAINVLVDISTLKQSELEEARRADVQTALYRFTDRLYRATDMEQAIDAALDAIISALDCTRASILLFDAEGVARFVGWRGLSDGYRAAVEGHSPWKAGDRDPQPIFLPDIGSSGESEALKRTVLAEGIRGLAFIPVVANGGAIGKFMAYDENPRVFSDEEKALAVTIARQLGFSIERRRAEEARRVAEEALLAREERLRAVVNSTALGVAILDMQTRFLEVNGAFGAITGYSAEELKQRDCLGLTHPDDRAKTRRLFDELIEGKRDSLVLEKRYFRKDGSLIWAQNSMSATHDTAGKPMHLVVLCQDITERKKAEAQRDLMVAELSHRVKNTLATVITIARQSFGKDLAVEEARHSFDGRIRALAQTHGRLAEANWSGVGFREILSDELAPYRREDGGNVKMAGPDVKLAARYAVSLGMAFHELATNAAKYGSLSVRNGAIEVDWTIELAPRRLSVRWVEKGGPGVKPPKRSGFGRLLLERALAADLDGDVKLEFVAEGVRCALTVPLESERDPVPGLGDA